MDLESGACQGGTPFRHGGDAALEAASSVAKASVNLGGGFSLSLAVCSKQSLHTELELVQRSRERTLDSRREIIKDQGCVEGAYKDR